MANDPLREEWYKKARQDIAIVRHMQTYNPMPIELICYHCQQAAEKALKGLLASKNIDIPITHRLGILLDTLNDGRLSNIEDDCVLLSGYAVTTRYPSPIEFMEVQLRQGIMALDRILDAISVIGYPVE